MELLSRTDSPMDPSPPMTSSPSFSVWEVSSRKIWLPLTSRSSKRRSMTTLANYKNNYKTSSDLLKNRLGVVDSAVDKEGAFSTAAGLVKSFAEVEQHAIGFTVISDAIAKYKALSINSNFLHGLHEEARIRDDFSGLGAPYGDAMDAIENNFGKVQQSGTQVDAAITSIKNYIQFIESRENKNNPPQTPTNTIGFSDGFNDLEKLQQDVQSTLLTDKGKLSADGSKTLRLAVEKLGDLKAPMETFDQSWTSASSTANGAALQILEVDRKLAEQAGTTKEGQRTIMDALRPCDIPNATHEAKIRFINTLQQKIDALNEAVSKLSSFEYIDKLKDLKPFKDAVKPLDTADFNVQKANAVTAIDALQAIPNYAEMLGIFNQYADDLAALQTFVQEFGTKADGIVGDFNNLPEYSNGFIGKWVPIYDCVRDDKKDVEKLAEGIRLVQAIRDLKGNNKVSEAIKFVEAIGDKVKTLTELQTSLIGAKPSDGDLSMIKLFTDSATTAQSFGLAVDGLIALKKARENKADVDALKNMLATVKAEADKFRGRLSTEDYQEIGKLGTLIGQLEAMFTGIDQFETAVGNLTPTTIPDYFVAFQAAQAVPSITIDVGKIKKALDKLALLSAAQTTGGGTGGGGGGTRKKRAPSPIDPAVTSLTNLEKLELNFANFQFAAASTPLASLDSFFTAMTVALQAQAAQNGPGGSGPAGAPEEAPSDGKLGGGDQEEQSSGSFGLGLFVGVMIIFAIAGIGAGIYYYLHKKKTIGKGQKTQKSSKSSKKEPEQGFEEISDPLTPRQNIQK